MSDHGPGACSVPDTAFIWCIGYSSHFLDLVPFYWCESVCWIKNLETSEKRVSIKEMRRMQDEVEKDSLSLLGVWYGSTVLQQTGAVILEVDKTAGQSLAGDIKSWVDGISETFSCLFSHGVSSVFFSHQFFTHHIHRKQFWSTDSSSLGITPRQSLGSTIMHFSPIFCFPLFSVFADDPCWGWRERFVKCVLTLCSWGWHRCSLLSLGYVTLFRGAVLGLLWWGGCHLGFATWEDAAAAGLCSEQLLHGKASFGQGLWRHLFGYQDFWPVFSMLQAHTDTAANLHRATLCIGPDAEAAVRCGDLSGKPWALLELPPCHQRSVVCISCRQFMAGILGKVVSDYFSNLPLLRLSFRGEE